MMHTRAILSLVAIAPKHEPQQSHCRSVIRSTAAAAESLLAYDGCRPVGGLDLVGYQCGTCTVAVVQCAILPLCSLPLVRWTGWGTAGGQPCSMYSTRIAPSIYRHSCGPNEFH